MAGNKKYHFSGPVIIFRGLFASNKPVTHLLLPPLAALLLLMFVGAGAIMWQQHRAHLSEKKEMLGDEFARDFSYALEKQGEGLATATLSIAADSRVRQALRDGDSERLLADWADLFAKMHREQNLTHFYFFDAERRYLARLYDPAKRGGTNNRFTAREAERTGMASQGIELGGKGTLTLRVVRPVFDGATLVGYVELGKEIEDLLRDIHRLSGNKVAVTLRKDVLFRKSWEEGMRVLGREANWERLPNSVVAYATQGRLPAAFAPLEEYFSAGDHAQSERTQEISTDGKVWSVTVAPLEDVSGKEVGDLMVMSDITADKNAFTRTMVMVGVTGAVLQAGLLILVFVMLRRTDVVILAQQERLKQKGKALARSNTELEQFAYVVSHDLRQPLRMVNSYMKLLERALDDKLDGETREMMEFAAGGARRMDQMLVSLLEYSRVGRMGEPMAPLASCKAVEEALYFLGPAIEETGAKVNLSGEWPQIVASRDEFTRLWQNLIGNALKYRDPDRVPEVDITVAPEDGGWRFCVADNGIGIDPQQFDRLFKVFQRLHTRDKYEGTGIGLAVARKIVERHGGRIWVESEGAGQGCRFVFTLPKAQEAANASSQ